QQQHVPAGTASSAAPESVKKTLALAGQLAHVGSWLVQLAEMAVALGLFTYRGQAQLTGIAQRTTAKRREAQPQHQAHVDLVRGFGDAVFQAACRLDDHRQ